MAETAQLEGKSDSEGQGQGQQQQTTNTPTKNCEGPPEEGAMGELHDPSAQSDEFYNDSSDPSSPPAEDYSSSGGEDPASFMTPEAQLVNGGNLYWVSDVLVSNQPLLMTRETVTTAWSDLRESDPLEEGMSPLLLDQQPFLHAPPPQMMMMVQSEGDGHQPLNSPNSPPPPEDLKKMLLQQVEYYFSKENLSNDKYLLSQMDGDHFVPVSIIANFSKVKRLSTDMGFIVEAIKESVQLQLDDGEEKVRAVPEKRCVLILREIPKETPKEQITSLFVSESCPKYVTCEFAENDCWYVTFDTEEETQKAFGYLREEVREFLGHPIRARIKGTTVQRPSAAPKKSRFTYPMGQSVYNSTHSQMPYYQPPIPWSTYYDPNYTYVNGYSSQQPYSGSGNRYGNRSMERGGGRGSSHHRDRGDRGHSPPLASSESDSRTEGRTSRGEQYQPSRYRREGEDQKKNIPRLRNKQRGGGGATGGEQQERNPPPRQQTRQQPKLDLAPANFPPLPTSESGVTPPTPIPPPLPNHIEEGVSNLADIVKGKRLKDSPGNISNGTNSTPEKASLPVQPPQAPTSSKPPPQTSITVQTTTTQSNSQSQLPLSKPQRPEAKQVPPRESRPITSNSRGSSSWTSGGDRDSGTPNKPNNYRNSQVSRSEAKSSSGSKGRHRDRDYKDRDKRQGSNGRHQPPRPSPKPPKKQAPPPPPTTPTSEKNTTKPDSKGEVTKSERLSYAQMAQKAKAAQQQQQQQQQQTAKTVTNNNSNTNGGNSNQSKQQQPPVTNSTQTAPSSNGMIPTPQPSTPPTISNGSVLLATNTT